MFSFMLGALVYGLALLGASLSGLAWLFCLFAEAITGDPLLSEYGGTTLLMTLILSITARVCRRWNEEFCSISL